MKKTISKIIAIGIFAVSVTISGCDKKQIIEPENPNTNYKSEKSQSNTSALSCTAQAEQLDYSIFKISDDGYRVGDVMPYYDSSSNSFYVYYLKDIWNDGTHQRHPWWTLKTSNFHSYTQAAPGEVLSCSTDPCSQDYAIGTGSVVKKGSSFYAFYTGHNPNFPSSCVTRKEGVMLATSTSLSNKFVRNTSFATIYAPTNQGYDQQDNFRDPYVFYDATTSKYYMILSARKDVNGTWKGVIPYYTSTNLSNWTYQGVLYDGGLDNFFMLETPEIFKSGSTYYLIFSDINTKHVYYRKALSVLGPWSKPVGPDRFDGTGIYGAKSAIDKFGDRYIFGWTYVQENDSDNGNIKWGGNLVVHKMYPKANGDLAVTIPHTVKSYLETNTHPVIKNSQWGNVTNTIVGTHSYNLKSPAPFDIANVIFDPINLEKYKINCTVNYSSSSKDFGFMIGACDGYEEFFSLRFIPSQNRFSLDKKKRSLLTTTTIATTDVPIALNPNTDYNVQVIVENSMLVVYLNNEVALSTRIYKATNTNWGVFVDHGDATFKNITVTKP